MNDDRRRILAALASLLAMGGAGGCRTRLPKASDLCALDSAPVDPDGLLLIDTHAHVFNGSDLQIREFVAKIAGSGQQEWKRVIEEVGGILQMLGWHLAPSGADELRLIQKLKPLVAACHGTPTSEAIHLARKDSYGVARQALISAAGSAQESISRSAGQPESAARRNFKLGPNAQGDIARLPEDYVEYSDSRERRARPPLPDLHTEQKTPSSILDFVIQHFNYRLINVLDYLNAYNLPSGHVDLLVTSLVDFDYWLSGGTPTHTSIPDQIRVMEQISVLTGGRVHGFVPFCPFREAATSANGGDGESFTWVRDAIANRGFIGVKLYPPMGFAPFGNAGLEQSGIWKTKPWLPKLAQRDDFGQLLDGALGRLYEWCEEANVPLMAHTGLSNYPHEDFKSLPGSMYWAKALAKWPALRVNFGHFGDSSPVADTTNWAGGFVKLMSSGNAAGMNAYADSGYFFDIVDRTDALKTYLVAFLKSNLQNGKGILRERFMYGSDWLMTVSEYRWGEFLERFSRVIGTVGQEMSSAGPEWKTFGRQFFGGNAANYLDLARARTARQSNRQRLEAFYARNGIKAPAWSRKVDRQFS